MAFNTKKHLRAITYFYYMNILCGFTKAKNGMPET